MGVGTALDGANLGVEKDYGTNCLNCERYKRVGEVCVLEHGKRFLWEYCRDFEAKVELPDYNDLMRTVRQEHALQCKKDREKKERERKLKKKEREARKEQKRRERISRARRKYLANLAKKRKAAVEGKFKRESDSPSDESKRKSPHARQTGASSAPHPRRSVHTNVSEKSASAHGSQSKPMPLKRPSRAKKQGDGRKERAEQSAPLPPETEGLVTARKGRYRVSRKASHAEENGEFAERMVSKGAGLDNPSATVPESKERNSLPRTSRKKQRGKARAEEDRHSAARRTKSKGDQHSANEGAVSARGKSHSSNTARTASSASATA